MSTAYDLLTRSDATISDCEMYRYSLSRLWGDGGMMLFVMLNPSTADASTDDPTIRRCTGFAKREKMGSLCVVNLFAFRSKDPETLAKAVDPTGPHNWRHVIAGMDDAETIVCAWGAHPIGKLNAYTLNQLAGAKRMVCLGKTKDGHPRHPLYLPSNQQFEAYP